jgi:hypothetical protein
MDAMTTLARALLFFAVALPAGCELAPLEAPPAPSASPPSPPLSTRLFRVSGDAIPFTNPPDGRIADAKVSLLEQPDKSMTTGTDGHFEFHGLVPGRDVTLVLEHPGYHPIQTGTLRVADADLERVTFQAVSPMMYAILAGIVGVQPDDEHCCQMVTTVTRIGKSMYDTGAHGEAGATVTLDPPLSAEHGPIYFNAQVRPDRTLTQTSDDGGVLFIQVPPGEYTWTASKPDAEFRRVRMKCRAGLLVNASPPWGLQRTK